MIMMIVLTKCLLQVKLILNSKSKQKIITKRKNLITEQHQRIQITKSNQSSLLDSESSRKKGVKFLKLQHNLNYINNRNLKTSLTQIYLNITSFKTIEISEIINLYNLICLTVESMTK